MSTRKTYETDPGAAYAAPTPGRQVVSRSLFAVVERGDMPLDCGFGEVEYVEAKASDTDSQDDSLLIRIDTVPQDTVVIDPDAAFVAASAMQRLSNTGGRGQLGFRVEYRAD